MATATAIEAAEKRPFDARAQAVNILGFVILGVVALYLLYKMVTETSLFFNVFFQGLELGALYALIALGYTLVYGIIELINFAHGDLFMLGTVFAGIFMVEIFGAVDSNPTSWIFFVLTLFIVMAMCAGLNMTGERLAYRRLRRAPKLASLITAVGLSFIFQWFGLNVYAFARLIGIDNDRSGSSPQQWDTIIGDGGIEIGDVTIGYSLLIVAAFTIPLLIGLTFVVNNTRQGKAMRATAQDQDAARLMGIDVDRTISFTFALGGAMAGAAGLLYMETVGTTNYNLGFQLGLIAFTAAVLGGIGNLTGAVVGGLLIGVIQGINDGLMFGQKWSQTVVFTILIMLMVFKPEGLLGKPTTEKV